MTTADQLAPHTKKNSRYNWIGLIVALAALAACLLFVLPAALAGNLFFAADVISGMPAQAIVYYHGQMYVYVPGDPQYDTIVDAAYQTLYHEIGIVGGFGWPEARYEQARTEGIAVELLYSEPVKIPGRRVDIADPVRLFFPLEVFGHEGEVVFRGGRDSYWGLPIHVDTLDRLRTAVEQVVNG